MGRKKYNRPFKVAAVQLVSKELSVHYNTLYRWISEYGEYAFPSHGSALYHSQYEIKRLKHENEELRKELNLLKKFQVFLKKKNV